MRLATQNNEIESARNPGRVCLAKDVASSLLEETKRTYPTECTLLLFGFSNGFEMTFTKAVPVNNLRNSKYRFAICVHEFEQAVRAEPIPFGGLYHSHSSTTYPSRSDRKGILSSSIVWIVGALTADHGRLKIDGYLSRSKRIVAIPVSISS